MRAQVKATGKEKAGQFLFAFRMWEGEKGKPSPSVGRAVATATTHKGKGGVNVYGTRNFLSEIDTQCDSPVKKQKKVFLKTLDISA